MKRAALCCFFLSSNGVLASNPPPTGEVQVALPSGEHIGLSTRGPSAFRVRFLLNSAPTDAIDTPMVGPDLPDAQFAPVSTEQGKGIQTAFGSVLVSTTGSVQLLDPNGKVLTLSTPIGSSGPTDVCTAQGADVDSCTRVGSPSTVDSQDACCAKCKNTSGCRNWVYGHPGDAEGNCWTCSDVSGIHVSSTRTLGGSGGGSGFTFSSNNGKLFGCGGGQGDGTKLNPTSCTPMVENKMTYTPHYYSTDGYAALGVVPETTGNGKTNYFPASYATNGTEITWTTKGTFELYLMPAASLDIGTESYYALLGTPRGPPRYSFGFIASRWGWQDRNYIESVLQNFRNGSYPIDAFITDFGWFTNVSDYSFGSDGEPWYNDFGFEKDTFPDPATQLAEYQDKYNFRMGGIRKPRLGNTDLLKFAKSKGWILPGGEMEVDHLGNSVGYADLRNINYSIPDARAWYANQMAHYYVDGVKFFWNDEGETDYFTFYWWNVAQEEALRLAEPNKDTRFYSINRAWSPGIARLGVTVWTGDVNPSWDDLRNTPGLLLNWGLAGAPYVTCDIGGFTGDTNGLLLTRWLQVGAFMPTMRVHSTKSATPHFPWLWGDYAGAMRDALNLRYQLVPYHYSLAHLMYKTQRLWMRPLAAEFPTDETAAPIASQWLDGDLLVSPVLQEDNSMNIYIPEGTWYNFNQSSQVTGPKTITGTAALTQVPVFVRPGAVVPLAPVIQFTDALPGGPLEVQVYAGGDGVFTLVEDDGETLAYEKSGAIRSTTLKWSDSAKTLSWTTSGETLSLAHAFTQVYVKMISASAIQTSAVKTLGNSGSITFATEVVV